MEFSRNLHNKFVKPAYYYSVSEFLTTFGDEKKNFSHDEYFKGDDLLECRKKAFEYYSKRKEGLDKRDSFFEKPFTFPGVEADVLKKSSAYSISLNFVQDDPSHGVFLYPIAGEDEETVNESLELERLILNDM
jgi:hypothetical protein